MKTVTSSNSKWYSETMIHTFLSQDRTDPHLHPLPLPKYRTPRLHFYFYKFFKGLKVLHKITKNKHFWIKIRIIIIYRERIYIWGGGDSEGGGSVLTSMHLAVISLGLCLCRVTYIHIIARPRLSLMYYHVIHKKDRQPLITNYQAKIYCGLHNLSKDWKYPKKIVLCF